MSAYVSKPTSFGDDIEFDSNSTPNINYYSDPMTKPQDEVAVATGQTPYGSPPANAGWSSSQEVSSVSEPKRHSHGPPWPTIIVSVLGAIVVIYTAVAPQISTDRRILGIVMITLWTIVWALILWALWKEHHIEATWWLLIIPVAIMALFFVLIILMDLGSQ